VLASVAAAGDQTGLPEQDRERSGTEWRSGTNERCERQS
jgi:hypothetical protein